VPAQIAIGEGHAQDADAWDDLWVLLALLLLGLATTLSVTASVAQTRATVHERARGFGSGTPVPWVARAAIVLAVAAGLLGTAAARDSRDWNLCALRRDAPCPARPVRRSGRLAQLPAASAERSRPGPAPVRTGVRDTASGADCRRARRGGLSS